MSSSENVYCVLVQDPSSNVASSEDNMSESAESSTTILEPGSPSPPPTSLAVINPFSIKQEVEEHQDKKDNEVAMLGDTLTDDTSHVSPPCLDPRASPSERQVRHDRWKQKLTLCLASHVDVGQTSSGSGRSSCLGRSGWSHSQVGKTGVLSELFLIYI